ncbi:hypothetical protein PHPALM_32135 [Phytophthora palmivora]|uniref:Uncharacterized protein n=1 Tax=Phytophthora palmivora TaxID=4796 RepID=A0A2P4X0U8_9STRA|nr:hypothetical protein PHPALM_32135 [Phytophthora palmivora]
MGHRGVKVMVNHFSAFDKLEQKARSFCARCLLCLRVKGDNIIPRPSEETYRCKESNEVLHMDYLSISEYNGATNYILVMKDDFSHFCELIECCSPDAATDAKAVLDWSSRYGMPKVSIRDTAHILKTNYLKSYSDDPEYHVGILIERLNRDVLQILRVMQLEYKVKQSKWAAILILIQMQSDNAPHNVLIGEDSILSQLRSSLNDIHHHIVVAKEEETKRNQSNQRGARPPRVNKLALKWIGPFRVISAKANSFDIEHLVTGTSKTVHASRLKLYADSSFEGHREHPEHSYEVLVGWEGLRTIGDSWELVKILQEDVPVKLNAYFRKVDEAKLHSFVSKLTLPCAGVREKEPIVQHPGTASQQRKRKNKSKHRRQKKNRGE